MFLRQIRCITHPTGKRYTEDYISSRQKLLWLTEPLQVQVNFPICQAAETSIFRHAANKEITCNNLEHLGTASFKQSPVQHKTIFLLRRQDYSIRCVCGNLSILYTFEPLLDILNQCNLRILFRLH